MLSIKELEEKAAWVRKETLKLHMRAPGTRIASSLSDVEIFVSLYYGEILQFDSKNPLWNNRDRLVISKGHGAISLYPILADLGFFEINELNYISTETSFLGNIPDTGIPGFETINGSVGHGLGIACGMALALKKYKSQSKVFILSGDGELNEGSVWEAVAFASFHNLNNIIMIVDNNKMSMLGYQKEILGLEPLEEKLKAFGWYVERHPGNNLFKLHAALEKLKNDKKEKPKALIADTIKGKGIPDLEKDVLSHVRVLNRNEIERILEEWNCPNPITKL
jgi:transketolase